MATLQQLINDHPTSLFRCTDGVSEYKYSQFIRNGKAVMYDNSEHDLNEDKWSIPSTSLDDLKDQKSAEIDAKTRQKIEEGFIFNGELFSLSEHAQLNWIGIKASLDILTFPIEVSTKGRSKLILTEVDSIPFCLMALGTKQYWLDTGRNLNILVEAATTVAELEAIIDDR